MSPGWRAAAGRGKQDRDWRFFDIEMTNLILFDDISPMCRAYLHSLPGMGSSRCRAPLHF
jgi:hypothetical protein